MRADPVSAVHSQFDVRSSYVSQPPLLVFSVLPNHLIRSSQHIRRNRHADLLGGLQIDDELELDRLLHGQVGGLRPFEDLTTYVAARRYKSGVLAP
jgi:hypothetical protein